MRHFSCHALTLLALAAPLCAEFKFNPLRRFTVTPGDGEALTERILALAGDSDLCVSLGACVVFERQWDKEQALAEWETLLQAVGYPGRG